ncbi:MAG TPA: hypothetical protein VHM24_04940, partial [Gemmatimonadaceae bacterium]|nr:hypothetical protein [Gemmatimonadaceae bacterium]
MRGLCLTLLTLTVACRDWQPEEIGRAPGAPRTGVAEHVDSILPQARQLDRFFGKASRPVRLTGGATTRKELVDRFVDALGQRDSLGLERLAVSREEYGGLYYPESPYSREPYDLPPDVAWMLNSEDSRKGLRRLLDRFSGHDLVVTALDCGKESASGPNRFAEECRVTFRDGRSR